MTISSRSLLAGLALLLGVASPRSAVAQSAKAGAKTPAKPGAASVGAPTSMSVKRLPLAVTDIADIVTLEKLEDRRDYDAAGTAYAALTTSCLGCHKHVMSSRLAGTR